MDIRFAYWVPNVSGGLVVSKVPQKTDWSFQYNKWLAQEAERAGFDYALAQARFFASYGAEYQLEALSTVAALASVTERLKLIAAVHPGLWHPGVVAKMGATIDQISGGRFAVNVVSGWFKGEFTGYGEPWLEHDERYRRSEEFIRVLKGMWSEERFTFRGDFYRIHDAPLKPKPIQRYPEVFQGGNSKAARQMAGRVSDLAVAPRNHDYWITILVSWVLTLLTAWLWLSLWRRYLSMSLIQLIVGSPAVDTDQHRDARHALGDGIRRAAGRILTE